MSLPWIPRISYGSGGSATEFNFTLPQRPWDPVSAGVGGSEESAAGLISAWQYRRDRGLLIRPRFWEHEWPAVEAWIAWAQHGMSFGLNLAQVGASTQCLLVSPRMGERIRPLRTEFDQVWEIELEVRTVDGSSMYEPYHDPQSGIDLILNGNFESSRPGYAPYWDPRPRINLLGPDAGVEQRVTGSARYAYVGTSTTSTPTFEQAEPLSWRGLTPGGVISYGAEFRGEGAAAGMRLRVQFWDSAGESLGITEGGNVVGEWALSQREGLVIPATAERWALFHGVNPVGDGVTSRRARVNLGTTLQPYTEPSHVVHQPARAYDGSRYLEIAHGGGSQTLVYALDADGSQLYLPVEPGDTVEFGGRVARILGDGLCRLRLTTYDAGRASPAYQHSTAAETSAYTAIGESYLVPAGRAFVSLPLQVSAVTAGAPTTARFSDVYLRIRRGG